MKLQDRVTALVNAARYAYQAQVEDPLGRASIEQIFQLLEPPFIPQTRAAQRLPAVAHLAQVCAPELVPNGVLRDLVAAFLALEPDLAWYNRSGDTTNANEAYWDGHANAMIVGPGGLVAHDTVWLGVSLLAPGVRYPDHTHPPEETYLVLSEGDFFQEGRGWFTPGMGGTFYNRPGILHAMYAAETPLFAMWTLRAE